MGLSDSVKNLLWQVRKNKKTQIVILVLVVIVAAVIAGAIIFSGDETVTNNTNTTPKTTNTGLSQFPRSIDGVWVEEGRENYFPVAVMVENLVGSRPQSGLDKANLVYEVLVEGGITRFMAVYASGEEVQQIGPVRSARRYYLDWVSELDSLYAHIGGSPETFELIGPYNIRDLNQFYNSQYFWRSSERYAPHNLYTSSELLARAVRDKEEPEEGDYDAWSYSNDEDPSDIDGKTLTIDFSTYNYQVKYVYDRKTNDFERYLAGEPHKMEDGSGIRAKNVVVQYVKTRIADSENRLSIETVGEGNALIYKDGEEIVATWKKPKRKMRTLYFDESGKEISFNRGTTWVEVVPTDRTVTFE